MEEEMNELKRQRDLAQSQLELERRSKKELKASDHHGPSRQVVKCLSFTTENEAVSGSPSTTLGRKKLLDRQAAIRRSTNSTNPSMLVHEIRKLEMRQRQLGDEANHALQLLHKEFASHRIGSQGATDTIAKLFAEIKELHKISSVPEQIEIKDKASLKEEIARLRSQENNIASLEQKLENVQRSIDELVMHLPSCQESVDLRTPKKKKVLPFNLSNTSNIPNIIRSPCSPMSPSSCNIMEGEIENRAPECNNVGSAGDSFCGQKSTPIRRMDSNCILSREGTPGSRQSNSVNMKKMQKMFKKAAEENIRSIKAYVTELKERVAKLQYQKQLLVCQVLELEANEAASDEADITDQSPLSWHLVFEDQRQQIIMLWHLCHVSLVHRTQFYMLFKGDPSDQIYMEVELRRLTWLDQHLAGLGNASPALLGDDPAGYVSSSIKALKQEREYLAKRVSSKLNAEEREMLYVKWDIPPEGKQRRRLQLVNKLWSDPLNMQNVRESAEVVAKLVGFCETGEHVSKEMFQLNFVSPCDKKTWLGDLGQTEWTASTLEHIGAKDYDVLLLPGDLSYADTQQPLWDSFGRLIEPYASKRPWMVTHGNHEIETFPIFYRDGFKAYNSRWLMPYQQSGSTSNLYYSFDVAGCHIIMLGSYVDFDPQSDQYTWLQGDLVKIDRGVTPWIFALVHAPWYNSNLAHKGEGESMRKSMEELLYKARVDVVFAGHVHAYERFTRVYDNKEDPCGPIYITIGDGGNREGLAMMFENPSPSISMFREASFGHGRLKVYNETHAHWSWHRNNEINNTFMADELWLQSFASSKSCLPEKFQEMKTHQKDEL